MVKNFTAQERLKSLQSRTEWSEIECVKSAIAEASQRLTKFIDEYKERVTKKQAHEQIRACSSALQSSKDDLSHHRHEMCLEKLHKAKDLTEQLKADPLLSTLPVAAEWMATFAGEYANVQKEYERVMLQRAVDDAIRVARGAFQETEDHLSHSVGWIIQGKGAEWVTRFGFGLLPLTQTIAAFFLLLSMFFFFFFLSASSIV